MQWQLRSDKKPQTQAELEEVLLENRALADPEVFFHPPQPTQLSLDSVGLAEENVAQAFKLIIEARAAQSKILVFGDYDADGICATAIMWQTLYALGCLALPFIPDRQKHGYGLSMKVIEELKTGKLPDLIITVDNGIVAHQAVAELIKLGVKVIVTDHHSPEAILPPASAIVHTTQLCGATVAWMFCRELLVRAEVKTQLSQELLDLAGIATIADQVPLVLANRAFAFWGIKALQETQRPGILAMCTAAQVNFQNINAQTIHYVLAPRINAMGRIEHGMDALRLLCTTNVPRAQQLATSVSVTNTRRQDLTSELLEIALSEAKKWENEQVIIVSSTKFHEGVIGLIAGKLCETYFKPAIVIAVGESKAKASARSIPSVNIVELIREVREDLLEVGGHPMAAGFGLQTPKLELVTLRLQQLAKAQIFAEQLVPTQLVDCVLAESLLNEETVELLARFEPFGSGNPEPVFALENIQLKDVSTLGSQQQHLKLLLRLADDQQLEALGWNKAGLASFISENKTVDLAATLELNEYKGRTKLQLKLKDVRLPE